MKKYSYLAYTISAVVLVATVITFNACDGGGEDVVDPRQKNTELITSGTWNISTVMVDGLNKTDLFTGFTIQFASDGTYTTTNGLPVWQPAGTWSFINNEGTLILRDDGREITIDNISSPTLQISMNWDKTIFGSGRASAISGDHVFTFTK
jgi:hypothetical protein